jgi:hypothetical protein
MQHQNERAFGYATAPLRVEYRPKIHPMSEDEILRWLDLLEAAGIRAWWYSVTGPHAVVLFPSRHLAYSQQAVPAEHFRWVARQAHDRGISVISHMSLAASPLSLREHPDWSMRYLEPRDPSQPISRRVPCFASPFRQRLTAFCVEVLTELGYDGFWFDSNALHDAGGMGCTCHRCAELLARDTGLPMPTRFGFDDPAFRQWIRWRQRFWMGYWQELTDAVRLARPQALLIFKGNVRLNHTVETAVPLGRSPKGALIADEVDWRPNQALLQMKCHRAMMRGETAPETWLGMSDGTTIWRPAGPEPEPAGLTLLGLTCMTGGGFASINGDPQCAGTLRAASAELNKRDGYVGGEPVRYMGLAVSGATNDFAHRVGTQHARPQEGVDIAAGSMPAWQAVHGMHYLLNALHLASEALLDDQLDDLNELRRYPVVILSDIQCITDASAAALTRYVQGGGVLIATADSGTRDELGSPRASGALDELLGIRQRVTEPAYIILEDFADDLNAGLPQRFKISGTGRLVSVGPDVRVLAGGEIIYPRFRSDSLSTVPADPPAVTRGAAITERRVGRGAAVYIAPNVGLGFSPNPNRRSRQLLDRLIRRYAAPPYEVDAPPDVAVSAWGPLEGDGGKHGGRTVFHVLNQPANYCRLDDANLPSHIEDVPPTGPVTISLPGRPGEVYCPTGGSITIRQVDGQTLVTLARLEMHEVIVCVHADQNAATTSEPR